MIKIKSLLIPGVLATLLLSHTAFAYNGDMLVNGQVNFSDTDFMEGKSVRIYASVSNVSSKDLLGVVRFFDNKYKEKEG